MFLAVEFYKSCEKYPGFSADDFQINHLVVLFRTCQTILRILACSLLLQLVRSFVSTQCQKVSFWKLE